MAERIATFAAGCFWGVEEFFRRVPGVVATEAGYTGGRRPSPSYEQVCSGATGHAEAVRVTFDDEQISYGELLDVFWRLHDPTQVDRQGPDVGSQYRSAVFTHDAAQAGAARAGRAAVQERLGRPVATQVVDAGSWWRAEERHQQYCHKRRIEPVCHAVTR